MSIDEAAPLTARPSDPHLTGLFAPVVDEHDVAGLSVKGELPPEIEGAYLRNGPNPRFTPLGSYLYPLDGDGMLHRVQIADGRVNYTNRFVRTPALRAEETAGKALWGGLTSMILPTADEVGPELAGTFKDLPDINVVRHAGRLLALAEGATPFLMGPALETLQRETFCGMLPAGITAHPKVDPSTGEMAVFCYGVEEPYLTWSILGRDGTPIRPPTPVPGVDRPVMIHDMALTARYLVVVLSPFYFDMAAAFTGGALLSWEPDKGTKVALIPRDGSPVRWADSDAFWLWHTANAHDGEDGTVVLDYVQWSYPGGLVAQAEPAVGGLARAVIDPARGTLTRDLLHEGSIEFPRVDERALTHQHRWITTVDKTGTRELPSGDADALRFFDVHSGGSVRWDAGNLSVGEASYVPRPGDADAEHGWWVTIATDRTELSSWFLVIPAADPASGPVARVRLPARVPLGLHGAWLPAEGS